MEVEIVTGRGIVRVPHARRIMTVEILSNVSTMFAHECSFDGAV